MMTGRTQPYADATAAGQDLTRRLERCSEREDVAVLALPRGGVPVASPVATVSGGPLDVLVRELETPEHPGIAMAAIVAWEDDPHIADARCTDGTGRPSPLHGVRAAGRGRETWPHGR